MTRSNAKRRILEELKNEKWTTTEIINILDSIGRADGIETLDIENILNAASLSCGTPIVSFKGIGGKRINILARSFCYLELREAGYTYEEIGYIFGRVHSTIVCAVRVIKQDLQYKEINDKYINFKERLCQQQ